MATYYVRKSGSDANNGTTIALAKLTIASAITASTTGDTIDIGEGTWAENINSSRVYKGVSMYKSIISAATSRWTSLTMTFQNIRVNHASLAFGGINSTALTYTDAIHDLSAVVPATAGWPWRTTTITMTRGVFIGPTSAFTNEIFSTTGASAINITNCVFYNLFGSALVNHTTAGFSLSMKNTIWYIASLGTAQPVSTSSTAWTLEQYNCFYSALSTLSTLPGGAFGTGTLNDIDPQFVDAVGGDFRLSASSLCIGTGHA